VGPYNMGYMTREKFFWIYCISIIYGILNTQWHKKSKVSKSTVLDGYPWTNFFFLHQHVSTAAMKELVLDPIYFQAHHHEPKGGWYYQSIFISLPWIHPTIIRWICENWILWQHSLIPQGAVSTSCGRLPRLSALHIARPRAHR
jgi:hypothetical protein